ncbi:MAG: STAS domain-containing protein [Pseudomonadota bacterium]
MNCGRVLYAEHDGTWVLRLTGDVRATWCSSLDALLERMFADTSLRSVVVDLRETTNIDSTMLGLLARVGVQTRKRLGRQPLLLSPRPDVRRLLDSMCLDKVLTIVDDEAARCACDAAKTLEIPAVDRTDAELCSQVTGAHRALMDLDERNRAAFHDVVTRLEDQQRINGR